MFCRAGKSIGLRQLRRLVVTMLGLTSLGLPALVLASGEVTELALGRALATPSNYDAGNGAYSWGQGLDLKLESFQFAGEQFTRRDVAASVIIRRVDNAVATGDTCSLFAEVDRRPLSYQADFPGKSPGICDYSTLFKSEIINRGAVDLFSNRDEGMLITAGNIERLDFVFPDGLLLPPGEDSVRKAGFLVTEKGGNSWMKVAAITAIDKTGSPTAYGKLLMLAPFDVADATRLRYGLTDISLDSDFLANSHTPPNGAVVSSGTRFTESIGAVFVSLQDLGLPKGDRVYGFSLFAADVDEQDDLADPTTFPLNTGLSNTPGNKDGWGGDADPYGGIAGYFVAASLREISGTLFRDADGSGTQTAGEDGVPNVVITLYQDDGDGRFDHDLDGVVVSSATSIQGGYRFVGLPDGQYWIGLDTSAPDFPKNHTLAGAGNPRLVTLSGSDQTAFDFALFPNTGSDSALLARPDSFSLMAGQTLLLDVMRNDRVPAGTTPGIVIAGKPAKGTLEIVGASLRYKPTEGQSGADQFSYTLQGAVGETSTTSVLLDIKPVAAVDSDGDGQLDAVDPDDDSDGIPDFIEGADDFDGDGISNQLDLDADGDGILDIYESSLSAADIRNLDPDQNGRIGAGLRYPLSLTDYVNADSDSDGRPDFLDLDSDNDGIDDVIEAGFTDRNKDGRVDGGKPVFRNPQDTDGNGIADFRQLDSDADGRYDIVEAGIADANDDGLVDDFVDIDTDGRSDVKKAVLGDGGNRLLDSNGNGVPDFQEVDANNLHTGLSGWGGGSSSLLYLVGLYLVSIRFLRSKGSGNSNLGRASGHE